MADSTGKVTHDGRFGERFDDEVSVAGVLWTTVGLAVFCILGMLITWGMWAYYDAKAEAAQPPLSPLTQANLQQTPPGPLLQRDPEGELEALRHEMSERLSTFGWVNESTGVAHIPIDAAMDLFIERAETASTAEPAPEAPE